MKTSWVLVLVCVWRGWVAGSFWCLKNVARCVIASLLGGVLPCGDCGAFFLWGVLPGRVCCLHLGFLVLAVDGADGDCGGEVVIKTKPVSRRGWRLVDFFWTVQIKMAAVLGREKVVKCGDLGLDGDEPAGIDALGGRGVVEVDDQGDDNVVGEFEIRCEWELVEVEGEVEEVVFLDWGH